LNDYFKRCATYDKDFHELCDGDETSIRLYFQSSGLSITHNKHHKLTNAGVLLCCKRDSIPRYAFHVHVKFVQKFTGDGLDLNEELFGSVLYLYNELYRRLKPLYDRRMGSPDLRDETGGEAVFYEYPEKAFVEALVNFLIHRDYSLDDIGFITIHHDSVEFVNPGQSDIAPEVLMSSTTALLPRYTRNQRLIEAFNKARLNEREGKGIQRIREALLKNGSVFETNRPGLVIENDSSKNRFRLIIFKRPSTTTIQQSKLYIPNGLHQLRPIPAEFTGRVAELDKLLTNIRTHPSSVTSISSINGMPGIGKTELANIAGHVLVNNYPDAQLFVDLGANTPMPLTPAQALSRCLQAFSPDAKLPEDETSLRNLYLSALQGKRALVILDDARDDAHVAPLLPPPGCAAIITSRYNLSVGTLFMLDVLPRQESIKLLCSFTARLGDCADTLAALCGDLPIALAIAGGYLKSHASKPVQGYIQSLQGTDRIQRLQVNTLFDYSFRALTSAQQAAFQSLAVMPADFDRPAALAVIGDEAADADVLDELVSLNLLQYDAKAARFRWHDLLREFARSRATRQVLDAAADRHSAHYLAILNQAGDLYLEGNDSIMRGLALYDQEAAHIQAGQAWAASHAAADTAAAQLCLRYPDAGAYVLSLRLHPREQISWLTAALSAARKLHERSTEGVHLGNLGLAYARLGDARKAINFYEQQLKITREIDNRRGEGNALGNLGQAYARLGDARKAIEYLEQALGIDREIGDRRGEGNALSGLGLAYADLGDARRAIDFYEQALAMDREIGDRQGEGQDLGNLGIAYADLGDARKAIEYLEQALGIDREIGDRQGEGQDLDNLGIAYTNLGDGHKAIEYHEHALAIAREIGNRQGEGNTLGNLGIAYANLGDAHKAIDFYEQALIIHREIGDRQSEALGLDNLGNAYVTLRDTHQAIELCGQALVILHQIGDPYNEAIASWDLGLAYEKQADIACAIPLMQARIDYEREIGHPDAEKHAKHVDELQAKLAGKGND
jgi:tetratricopeptide (TPR) repeat protein